jgi:sarcosine oxidase
MPMPNHFDYIVIGCGSMGMATCSFLAERGCQVLGIDQFSVPHESGSHAGQSRIIRKAYFEHPDYVPLLERAYQNWRAIERVSDSTLYYETGIVYFGKPEHPTMMGVKNSANRFRIPLEKVSPADTRKKFNAFEIPSNFETLFEPKAGFIKPEHSIRVYRDHALKNRAFIHENENVVTWKKVGKEISVVTDKAAYTCLKLIITAGAWTSNVLPQLRSELHVTRQVLGWFDPKDPDLFALTNFPCWFIEDPDHGMFYGFPLLPFETFGGPIGLKLASHRTGLSSDPDHVDRNVKQSEIDDLKYVLSKYLPVAGNETITTKTCLYTYSPDENFIIDHLPGYDKQITIACGFSGHGFKFVPVIGEILADLAIHGKTNLPIEFLSLKRFYNAKAFSPDA